MDTRIRSTSRAITRSASGYRPPSISRLMAIEMDDRYPALILRRSLAEVNALGHTDSVNSEVRCGPVHDRDPRSPIITVAFFSRSFTRPADHLSPRNREAHPPRVISSDTRRGFDGRLSERSKEAPSCRFDETCERNLIDLRRQGRSTTIRLVFRRCQAYKLISCFFVKRNVYS